jgi:hypothetical protein
MEENQELLGNSQSRKKSSSNNDILIIPLLLSIILNLFIRSKDVRIALIFLNIICALVLTDYQISMIVGWGAVAMVSTQSVICDKDRDCHGIDEAFKLILNGYR